MSRTYRHTKPEYIYPLDDDGWIRNEDWPEARKHYTAYSGWRTVEKRQRNIRLRRDRSYMRDFDDYTTPNDKIGWWD